MSEKRRPPREAQALEEVGRTEIGRGLSICLTLAFLATVGAVPAFQAIADSRATQSLALWPRVRALLGEARATAGVASRAGLLEGNRYLQNAIQGFEDRVEDESVLRDRLLPASQRILTSALGVGNERAYLGHDGWLFFREDFDHVVGRGFLDEAVLRRAELIGELTADPVPAIVDFHRQLRQRGIELLLVPTPLKPTVHPERFGPGVDPARQVRNRSFGEFLARLKAAGVEVFDPGPALANAKQADPRPLFLRSDTHWTPEAMDLVARAIAESVENSEPWMTEPTRFSRSEISVEGTGDIAAMLELPAGVEPMAAERLEIARVVQRDGRPWRSSKTAEILLLGDSFTNVYSDPGLGWGVGSGLAEQLSFHLQRSVDRIAVNDGGALSSRQALARALQGDPHRLDPKRIVVYQFAARELSSGDWKPVSLPDRR